jgi:SAM-dependent methyltransferase
MIETNPATDLRVRRPMPMKPTGPCWICRSDSWKRVGSDVLDLRYFPRLHPYDHGEHPPIYLARCRACGFSQPEAMPDLPEYFDVIYDQNYAEADLEREFNQPFRDFIYRKVLEDLSGLLKPGVPRTLLDVGCFYGRFIHVASRAGWQAEGVEIDPTAAAFAGRRTGLPVHNDRAQDLASEGRRYGALTMNDVLEHIPQPGEVVRNLRPLLHPGGILAIKVPHGPVQNLKEGFRKHVLRKTDALRDRVGVMTNFVHVNHFSVASMRRMLEDAGYRVLRITTAAPELNPPKTLKFAVQTALRRGIFTAARLLPGGVHTPLGLNLQAYALRAED